MHLFDKEHGFYGGNAIVAGVFHRGRAGAGRQDAGPRPGDGVFLRGRRDGRRGVARVHEPRATVEPSGLLRVREQPLRDGHGVEPVGIRDQPGDQGLGL